MEEPGTGWPKAMAYAALATFLASSGQLAAGSGKIPGLIEATIRGSCLIFLGAMVGGVGNGLVGSGMGFETFVWACLILIPCCSFGTPSFMSSLVFLQTRDVNGVPLRKRGHKPRV